MKKNIFNLKPTDEFIELIRLLKYENIANTGGHAKILVEDGFVYVNDELEFRKRRKLRPGDVVECDGTIVEVFAAK